MTDEQGAFYQQVGSRIAAQIITEAMKIDTDNGSLADVCTLLESVIIGVLLACAPDEAADKLILKHLMASLHDVMPELRKMYEAERRQLM